MAFGAKRADFTRLAHQASFTGSDGTAGKLKTSFRQRILEAASTGQSKMVPKSQFVSKNVGQNRLLTWHKILKKTLKTELREIANTAQLA